MEIQEERYKILKSIYSLNRRMSCMHAIQGIDISRCFEYTEAYLQLSFIGQGKHILDIGSYRSPFPAFLVQQGYQVSMIDIDYSISMQKIWMRRALGFDACFSIIIANGICLPFSTSSFDFVTCISTIEHLPGEGDMYMSREIGRVLRPGGYCFLSVPYMIKSKEGTWGKWFQRWYDVPSAMARILKPSGLLLISYGFLMGGKIGKIFDVWYKLPRIIRHAFSWSHILLFPTAFEKDKASQLDSRVLWMLLQKQNVTL